MRDLHREDKINNTWEYLETALFNLISQANKDVIFSKRLYITEQMLDRYDECLKVLNEGFVPYKDKMIG